MPKYLMDRIFARLSDLNQRWLNLVTWMRSENWTPEQLQEEVDILRQEFANIISLAQPEAWRLFAQSEGITLPDESDPDGTNQAADIS